MTTQHLSACDFDHSEAGCPACEEQRSELRRLEIIRRDAATVHDFARSMISMTLESAKTALAEATPFTREFYKGRVVGLAEALRDLGDDTEWRAWADAVEGAEDAEAEAIDAYREASK
jgi:hypothetical protein